MHCLRDEEIDEAAVLLLEAGVLIDECFRSLAIKGRAVEPRVVDPRLLGLLRHCRRCAACRERLLLLQRTERALREERARHGADRQEPLVLSLVPIPGFRRPMGEEEGGFDMAAQTLGPEPDGSSRPNVAVLTLVAEDDSFLVRIFPNEGGEGATAVLLSGQVAQIPPERIRARIRVGGREYEFDGAGRAALPSFPASKIELLLG
jgi:hypothetical protein